MRKIFNFCCGGWGGKGEGESGSRGTREGGEGRMEDMGGGGENVPGIHI